MGWPSPAGGRSRAWPGRGRGLRRCGASLAEPQAAIRGCSLSSPSLVAGGRKAQSHGQGQAWVFPPPHPCPIPGGLAHLARPQVSFPPIDKHQGILQLLKTDPGGPGWGICSPPPLAQESLGVPALPLARRESWDCPSYLLRGQKEKEVPRLSGLFKVCDPEMYTCI